MDSGERQLGHEEVVRDPLEVGEGLARAHPGLCMVAWLDREKPAMGWSVMGYASERNSWRL
jgi:hypothetical protein